MARVLIIGASGFVGSELVKQLKDRGDQVCALYHTQAPDPAIDKVKADIRDALSISKSLKNRKFDVVYHVASLPGDTGNPLEMIDVNVCGLLNVLEWARSNPVKRYVLTSSISAYEWYPATKFNAPDYMPVNENHPCRPKDMYATTKRMQELLAITYYHQYKVPTTILRLTAVVGPGGKGGGRGWREFAHGLEEGRKVQIPHFTPQELCHYVDLRDVARMHIVVSEHPNSIDQVFNCCASQPTRGTEFIDIVKRIRPGIEVECGFPWSMAQGQELSFDMSKAKELLGFEPKYTLADAVQSIKDWVEAGGLAARKVGDRDFEQGVQS